MHPPGDLDAAYRATAYTVRTPEGTFTLRVGQTSAELECILASRGCKTWAFVTAYNPGSVLVSAAENEARQRELRAEVAQIGHLFFEGTGVGAEWPPEPSLLVIGMDEAGAAALGHRFGQMAVVVGEYGGPARLLWLLSSGADSEVGLRL